MIESNSIKSFFWGLKSYQDCEILQAHAWNDVFESQSFGLILGGEILPTITQGVRGKPEDILSAKHFSVHQIKRGGETTLHSPGQLVIYPVLNVKKIGFGVRHFVETLLKVSAQCFEEFGVHAEVSNCPVGLFTQKGKIGFCGLQIKQGISQHGLSLNIQNDLEDFDSIVSCGLKKASYDKLENYNSDVSTEMFFNRWVELASLEGNLRRNQNPVSDWSLRDLPS